MHIKLFNFVVLINFMFFPSILKADELGNFANRLFNHYEYDDKINNYLKSFFSFSNENIKTKNNNKNTSTKNYYSAPKQSFKIKSKNKMVYDFGNGKSIQMNPTNIDDKVIYNSSPFTYFEIKKNSILYGINLNF